MMKRGFSSSSPTSLKPAQSLMDILQKKKQYGDAKARKSGMKPVSFTETPSYSDDDFDDHDDDLTADLHVNDHLNYHVTALQAQLSEVRATLADREDMCEKQAAIIEAFSRKISELEDDHRHNKNNSPTNSSSNNSSGSSSSHKLQKELNQVRSEKKRLSQQVTELSNQLVDAKKQSQKSDSTKVQDLESRLREANRISEILQATASHADEEKREYQTMVKHLQMEISKLKNEKASVSSQLGKTAVLENRLNDNADVIESLQLGLARAEKEKSQAMRQKEQVWAQVDALRNKLKERDEVIAATAQEQQQIEQQQQDKIRKLQQRVAELEVSNASRKLNDEKLHGAVEEAKNEKMDLLSKLSTLELSLDEARQRAALLQNQLADVQEDRASEKVLAATRLSEMEVVLNECQEEARVSKESLAKVSEEKKELERKVQNLQNNLDTANCKIDFLQSQILLLQQEKESENARSERNIAELKSRVKESTEQVAMLQESLTLASNQNKQLESKLEYMEHQLLECKANANFHETEAKRIIQFVQSKLDETEKESNSRISELEARLEASSTAPAIRECKLDEEKVHQLEKEAAALRLLLKTKEAALETHISLSKRQEEQIQDLLRRVDNAEQERSRDTQDNSCSGEDSRAQDLEQQIIILKEQIQVKDQQIASRDEMCTEQLGMIKHLFSQLASKQ